MRSGFLPGEFGAMRCGAVRSGRELTTFQHKKIKREKEKKKASCLQPESRTGVSDAMAIVGFVVLAS